MVWLIKQVVASGFGRGNVQALSNDLKWGPDGKIYFAAGIVGGDLTIFSPEGAEIQKLSIRGHDLRFDPLDPQVRSGQRRPAVRAQLR